MNLGPVINTGGQESTPTLSRDGLRLYFASTRPGGYGSLDLWVSVRHDHRDDLAWQEPVNLGPMVNSAAGDLGPTFFFDPQIGAVTLYFYSTRPRSADDITPDRDIYTSRLDENGSFTPAALVPELSTPFEDEQPSVRRDGLEIFFASNRRGSFGSAGLTDIWVSTRVRTTDPWSAPVNLGPRINTANLEARPALSFDGRSLFFFSNGHGGYGGNDLLVSARTRAP